nr:hypothetical protein WG33_0212 [uncultured bacterium]
MMVPPDEAIEIVKAHSGMTLRDYFAAQAMQATVAGCPGRASDNTADISYSTVAIDAYKFADAMLKARAAR